MRQANMFPCPNRQRQTSYRPARSYVGVGIAAIAVALSACSDPLQSLPLHPMSAPTPATPIKSTAKPIHVELIYQLQPQPAGSSDRLTAIGQVLERRAKALGLQSSVKIDPPTQQVKLRVTGAIDPQFLVDVLGQRAVLEVREQRPGTETQFHTEWTNLKNLQQQQQRLQGGKDPAAMAQNNTARQRSQAAIAQLFLPAVITNKEVADAAVEDAPAVRSILLQLTPTGDQVFAQLTQRLAGTGRAVGIFVDGVLLSAPIVGDVYKAAGIQGGQAQISGDFDLKLAQRLSVQLKVGSLPAPIKLLETKIIKAPAAK
jgi:preprotein translocase subunit SecD